MSFLKKNNTYHYKLSVPRGEKSRVTWPRGSQIYQLLLMPLSSASPTPALFSPSPSASLPSDQRSASPPPPPAL